MLFVPMFLFFYSIYATLPISTTPLSLLPSSLFSIYAENKHALATLLCATTFSLASFFGEEVIHIQYYVQGKIFFHVFLVAANGELLGHNERVRINGILHNAFFGFTETLL